MSIAVLVVSIVIQILAAYLALRLIPVTGRRRAWILISSAIFFMIVRRCLTLFETFLGGPVLSVDPGLGRSEEWISLITSILMLSGIALIAPLFRSIQRSTEALRESEEKYRRLFEGSRDAIYFADSHGALIDVNGAALSLFGYSREEMIGLDVRHLYVDDAERLGLREELWKKGFLRDYEMTLRRKDGEEMHCILTATMERDQSGVVLGYQGIVRNITQRREMEERLKENNKILSAVLAASPIGICRIHGGVVDWVNDAMCRMLGYAFQDLQNIKLRHLYSDPKECDRTEQELREGMERSGIGSADTRWVRRDGTVFNCYLQASALDSSPSRREEILAAMDITELKRTEEALRESEERYRSFFEEDLTGVYIASPEGGVSDCNPAFARIFGFGSVEEALRSDVQSLCRDRQTHENFLRLLKNEKKLDYYPRELRRCDGKPLHVIESTVGVFDAQGELRKIRGYIFDNTALRSLEEQLLHSQKMEAIGRLAGGVAHDFNNLLTAISGYSELMLMKIPRDDPLHLKAEEIKKAAERASSLTRQLLAFSRKQVLQPRVLDLNTVIVEMEKILRRVIGEDIDLLTVLDPHLGRVKTDPGQIEQVIMNLAVNARDAMPQGGNLTIETSGVELDEAYSRQHVAVKPGPYAMIAVSDTGVGMDSETLTRIFEPFFTTKEKGKGTGLGLATVYGIVSQSEGHIWVYSEPGRGTTFKIYLPIVKEDAPIQKPAKELDAAAKGWETILLVEDDEMVRAIICESLRLSGYTVLEARQGEEAISLSQEYGGPIQLLVTDVVMPGMNGCELAERLAAGRPQIKSLFMSGYTDKAIVHNKVLDSTTAFLQKPFRLEALLRMVREVLNAEES